MQELTFFFVFDDICLLDFNTTEQVLILQREITKDNKTRKQKSQSNIIRNKTTILTKNAQIRQILCFNEWC